MKQRARTRSGRTPRRVLRGLLLLVLLSAGGAPGWGALDRPQALFQLTLDSESTQGFWGGVTDAAAQAEVLDRAQSALFARVGGRLRFLDWHLPEDDGVQPLVTLTVRIQRRTVGMELGYYLDVTGLRANASSEEVQLEDPTVESVFGIMDDDRPEVDEGESLEEAYAEHLEAFVTKHVTVDYLAEHVLTGFLEHVPLPVPGMTYDDLTRTFLLQCAMRDFHFGPKSASLEVTWEQGEPDGPRDEGFARLRVLSNYHPHAGAGAHTKCMVDEFRVFAANYVRGSEGDRLPDSVIGMYHPDPPPMRSFRFRLLEYVPTESITQPGQPDAGEEPQ